MHKIQSKKQMKSDEKISIAIFSPFVVLTIQYLILLLLNFSPYFANRIQIISKSIVFCFYLWALPNVLKKNARRFLYIILFSSILFIMNIIIYPENGKILENLIFPFFATCLPSFAYTLCIENEKVFYKAIKTSSEIIFFVGIIIGYLVLFKKIPFKSYSMTFSYYLLLPGLCFLSQLFKKFKVNTFIKFLIVFFLILTLGSRGAVVSISIFILINFTKLNFIFKLTNILNLIATYFSIFVIIIKFNKLISLINNIFLFYGIKSRTLMLLTSNQLYLSGRNLLYEKITTLLKNYVFIGAGLGADRIYLDGGYVHNIFLELFLHFGVITGILIIIFIFLKFVKSLKLKDFQINILLLCLGFIPLLMSSSYLLFFNFWVFLGYILNTSIQKFKIF